MKLAFKTCSVLLAACLLLTMWAVPARADGETYTLTIVGGTDATQPAPQSSYAAGTAIPLVAQNAAEHAYWASDAGGAFTDALQPNTTFIMPAANVTLTAHAMTGRSEATVSGVSFDAKTYDGTPATFTGTPRASLPDGTDVTTEAGAPQLFYTDASGAYASASAPAAPGSYTLTVIFDSATYVGGAKIPFTIGPKPISITGVGVPDSKVYDGTAAVPLTLDAAAVDAAGVVAGDSISLDASVPLSGATADAQAGSAKPITFSGGALTGADASKYELVYPVDTIDITPYVLTADDLEWSGTADRKYDPLVPSNVTASVKQAAYKANGDNVTLTVAGGDALEAGTYAATANAVLDAATGQASVNYALPAGGLAVQYTVLPGDLTGTANIKLNADNGTAGKVDVGDTLGITINVPASLLSPVYTYQWNRNGTAIAQNGTGDSYTVTQADAGQLLSVSITAQGNYNCAFTSDSVRVLPVQLAGSITFSGTGAPGTYLQAAVLLNNGVAVSGTHYTLQWYFDNTPIAGATTESYLITQNDLGRNITLVATAVSGESAPFSGSVSASYRISAVAPAAPTLDVATTTGQITCAWIPPDSNGAALTGYVLSVTSGGAHVSGSPFTLPSSTTSYALSGLPGGINYTVSLTAVSTAGSSQPSTVNVTVMGAYSGEAPAAPTKYSRSTSRITLTAHNGYEYSLGGVEWQDSNVFSGLSAGKKYTFYQRIKATSTHQASAASPATSIYTLAETDDDNTGGTTGGSTTSSGSATPTPNTDVLFELVLADGSTNVLFSTVNRLIKGNEQKDVRVQTSNAVYSFAKGTMVAENGRVWYDFGVMINNCIHNTIVKQLAGDAHAATVHFNFDGTLPAEANIQLLVGKEFAGLTLYYYKYDATSGSLVYVQDSTVDVSGYASVRQSSCSDYAFLKQRLATDATPTPAPSATPAASASPTAEPAVIPTPQKTAVNWKLIGIIAGGVVILVGVIWLFFRSSREGDDEDEEDDDDDSFFRN